MSAKGGIMTLTLFILTAIIFTIAILSYKSSATIAKSVDKLIYPKAEWALTANKSLGERCIAMIYKQLSPTHYELKIYEDYKLRRVILDEKEFERIYQF